MNNVITQNLGGSQNNLSFVKDCHHNKQYKAMNINSEVN